MEGFMEVTHPDNIHIQNSKADVMCNQDTVTTSPSMAHKTSKLAEAILNENVAQLPPSDWARWSKNF